MKRRDLIKMLERAGFCFKEHGVIMIHIKEEATQSRFQGIKK